MPKKWLVVAGRVFMCFSMVVASTIVFGAEENVPFTLSIGPQFQKICGNQIAVPYKLTNIAKEPRYIAQFPGISLAVNCQEKSGSVRFSIPGGVYSEDGNLPRDYFVKIQPGEGLHGIGVVAVPADCSQNISIQGVYQSTGGGLHLGLHAWKGDVRSASLPFSWSGGVTLKFEAATPSDAPAAKEYEAIWAADGIRIVQALEARSGLSFEESEIHVVVVEAPSNSGFKKIPMNLRSSYPLDTKKATLVHELGHRLQGRLFTKDDEDHPFLFLYLYDVWVSLFGKEFADQQVKVESERRGYYDYESAWRTTLAMTAEQRFAKWQEFLKSRES